MSLGESVCSEGGQVLSGVIRLVAEGEELFE